MRRLSALFVLALVLVASGPVSTARHQPSVIRYTATLEADHYVSQMRGPAPVAVLVHGCCGDRRDMAEMARALARTGAVVLSPDVRAFRHGGGWPATYEDVVCAVAAGRHLAIEQDANTPVALIGWGDGALVAAAVTLGWSTISPRADGCTWPVPLRGPDVLTGISGHYGWPPDEAEPVDDGTIAWFGGPPTLVPRNWQLGNPAWWAAHAAPNDVPPIVLLASMTDVRSETFASELRAGSHAVTLLRCGDASHEELIIPRGLLGSLALGSLEQVLDIGHAHVGCQLDQ